MCLHRIAATFAVVLMAGIPSGVYMEATEDPYKVLGVETDASAKEIKKAFRKLALKSVCFFCRLFLRLSLALSHFHCFPFQLNVCSLVLGSEFVCRLFC